jgi:hypothetical protein
MEAKELEVYQINQHIQTKKKDGLLDSNLISDGYHSFGELYEHRIRLFLALCKERKFHADTITELGGIAKGQHHVWAFVENESEEWFLMGINKEKGEQITYHLPARFWSEVCEFAEILKEKPEFDGHTSADVLERLKQL